MGHPQHLFLSRFWRGRQAGVTLAFYRSFDPGPHYPPLQFKHVSEGLWSVRIGAHYRALAHVDGQEALWVWIGHHAEYDQLI